MTSPEGTAAERTPDQTVDVHALNLQPFEGVVIV